LAAFSIVKILLTINENLNIEVIIINKKIFCLFRQAVAIWARKIGYGLLK